MKIEVVQGDITQQDTVAIVNAANSSLLGGSGVDGAIHRVAGPRLLAACKQLRATTHPDGLPVGEAVITPGFDLTAKYVIHTVGPVYSKKEDRSQQLAHAFLRSLELADSKGVKSVAFPAISTGAYGYPKRECARIIKEVFLSFKPKSLDIVRVVLFSHNDYILFRDELGMLLG